MRPSVDRDRLRPHVRLMLWTILTVLGTGQAIPAAAGDSASEDRSKIDCRYEGIGLTSSGNADSSSLEIFPENDVFRPLWADPKQPQFFASWQGTIITALPRTGSSLPKRSRWSAWDSICRFDQRPPPFDFLLSRDYIYRFMQSRYFPISAMWPRCETSIGC